MKKIILLQILILFCVTNAAGCSKSVSTDRATTRPLSSESIITVAPAYNTLQELDYPLAPNNNKHIVLSFTEQKGNKVLTIAVDKQILEIADIT